MKKKTILIAEDEEGIRSLLVRGLGEYGYDTLTAQNSEEAWDILKEHDELDLLLLDIRMPGQTGLELCRKIRLQLGYTLPIIMITALGETDDVVAGLNAGADGYMVKPFKFLELLARIEALLRRSNMEEIAPPPSTMQYGCLTLYFDTHTVEREGVLVELSMTEFRLLQYMVKNSGQVISRKQILSNVWERDFETGTNIVDVYIRYLRNKLDDTFSKKIIHTVVGIGYMIRP